LALTFITGAVFLVAGCSAPVAIEFALSVYSIIAAFSLSSASSFASALAFASLIFSYAFCIFYDDAPSLYNSVKLLTSSRLSLLTTSAAYATLSEYYRISSLLILDGSYST
jgi:Golgi nucleoside diphosphatase